MKKHKLCYNAASSFYCPILTSVYTVNSINVSLFFSDSDRIDYIYTGETTNNAYFVNSSTYSDESPYSFHTVCFSVPDNIYNTFAFKTFSFAKFSMNISKDGVFSIP